MSDVPAQKFRYGFVIKNRKIENVDKKCETLDNWFNNRFSDFEGVGFDGGLTYQAGWLSEGEYIIVGVPILADEAVYCENDINQLGNYVAGKFSIDTFVNEVNDAINMYESNIVIEKKIRDVFGDIVPENPSIVTASGSA